VRESAGPASGKRKKKGGYVTFADVAKRSTFSNRIEKKGSHGRTPKNREEKKKREALRSIPKRYVSKKTLPSQTNLNFFDFQKEREEYLAEGRKGEKVKPNE